MKKVTLTTLLVLFIAFAWCQQAEVKTSTAEVNQMQGISLFCFSKPVAKYTYLGSVKIKVVWTGQPEEMLNITLKKIKKDYPAAEGIIFTTINMDQADVIKFD